MRNMVYETFAHFDQGHTTVFNKWLFPHGHLIVIEGTSIILNYKRHVPVQHVTCVTSNRPHLFVIHISVYPNTATGH